MGHTCRWPFSYTNSITHESVYSSPSLLNEYFRYDKLWGPSQRVVTLFFVFCLLLRVPLCDVESVPKLRPVRIYCPEQS